MVQILLKILLLTLLLPLSSCRNLFFYPEQEILLTPDVLHLKYSEIQLTTPDGETLHSWMLEPEGAPRASILFLHGNAENISTHIQSVAWLPALGFEVLLLEYRGYGSSSGSPSVHGCITDIHTALAYLGRRSSLPVIVFGQSIGGALGIAALALKSDPQVKALITEGTFASYRGIVRDKLNASWLTWVLQYPLSWLISDSESPVDLIGSLQIPKLIIHGEHDSIVPVEHAHLLFSAAKAEKLLLLVPGKEHIESSRDDSVRRMIVEFAQKALRLP